MNMQQMVQAMQKAQREFNKEYAKLEEKEFKMSSNGAVEVTMLGDFTIKEIKVLDKELLKPENEEELTEMIILAYNKIKDEIQKENDVISDKFKRGAGNFF